MNRPTHKTHWCRLCLQNFLHQWNSIPADSARRGKGEYIYIDMYIHIHVRSHTCSVAGYYSLVGGGDLIQKGALLEGPGDVYV